MCFSAHGPAEHAHVVAVPARDDHQVTRSVGLQFLERIFVSGVNLVRHRKPFAIRKLFPVVNHPDAETRRMRRLGQGHRDVSSAKNIQRRLRQDGLDENLERAPANQPIVVAGLVVQVKGHLARRFAFQHVFRRRPDFRFDAPAADGSQDGSIFLDQHPRAFKARNGAIRMYDGRHHAALAFAAQAYDFLE